MVRFLLFVAFLSELLGAQPAAAAGELTGRVTDRMTKEGIRKVTVFANQEAAKGTQSGGATFTPPTIYSAVTDDAGVFRFPSLPPAGYVLRAEKPGYISRQLMNPVRAEVVAGKTREAAELHLLRHAVLAGTVTDGDGDPLESMRVAAVPISRAKGRVIRQSVTDDRGHYRIARLEPGTYKVVAVPQARFETTAAAGERPTSPAPTYYPAALDFAAAGTVTAGSGQERTGVDIRVQQAQTVRVAGRLTGGQGMGNVIGVSLQPTATGAPYMPRGFGGALTSLNTMTGPAGVFVFERVMAGEYVLQAHGPNGINSAMRLQVGQQDIDSLVLPLETMVKMTGRVRAEGTARLPSGEVRVALRNADEGMPGGGGTMVRPDGTFTLENLPRQPMRFEQIAPRGWYLKSILAGGQPQNGLTVDLRGGDVSVEAVYSDRPGTVLVNVEGLADGEEQIVAAVLPDSGNGPPPLTILYRTSPVAAGQNAVKIEDVAPGKYFVVACPMAYLEEFSEAATWERVKGKAAAVSVGEGETIQASPRLIVESDVEEK